MSILWTCAVVIVLFILATPMGNVRNPLRRIRNELMYRLPVSVPGVAPCPDCNIVVINFDTLRASELACYGYVRDTAPHLCAFARKNIRFSRFYTQTSFTLDSHMSVFTGLYPTTHHVTQALKDVLNPSIPTLPQVLAGAGYRTIWAGPTDDVNLPLDKGFERGFTEIHTLDGNDTDWQAKYAQLLPKLTDGTPTFLFLHTYAVHSPYLPGNGPRAFIEPEFPEIPVTGEEFRARSIPFFAFVLSDFRERLKHSRTKESIERNASVVSALEQAVAAQDTERAQQVFWTLPGYEQYEQYIAWFWSKVDRTNPSMVSYIQGLYDERIAQLDIQAKALFDFLDRPEVKRKTIVMIFSDNGEEFMEHGDFDHGWNIYNTSTHTPFIVAAPRMQNGVYHDLVQAVDMYPTIVDLVGLKLPAPVEGTSLRPIMEGRGQQQVGLRYLIGQHRGGDIISIRSDRWKLYKNNAPGKQYVEFFDLMKDPGEQHNILGEHLDIAGRLDNVLIRMLESSPKYASVSSDFPSWLDEESRGELIREGYF